MTEIYGNTTATPMNPNLFSSSGKIDKTNNVFSNALKGSKSGETISVDDVSPIEHSLDISVKSRNLCQFKAQTTAGLNFTTEDNGSTLVINGVVAELSATKSIGFGFKLPADTYVVTYIFENMPEITSNNYITTRPTWTSTYFKNGDGVYTFNITGAINDFLMTLSTSQSGTVFENTKIKCLIAKASDITQPEVFTPYIPDLSKVSVSLLNSDGEVQQVQQANADGTVEGLKSVSPNMTVSTDTEGVIINLEYNRDINIAFAKLEQAILNNA